MRHADLRRFKAAACAALALVLAGTPALAQWRDGGRNGWRGGARREAYQDRGDRSGDWRARGVGGRDFGGYGAPRGGGQRFGGYGAPAYAPQRRTEGYGGYPQPIAPGGGRAWRRGEVLPDGYRGASVADPGRYHLRRPPNGYDWVGDNRNAYLMQRSTGMVLDSVPGAYDTPPPYRGRRR